MTKCDINLKKPAYKIQINDKGVAEFIIENKDKWIINIGEELLDEMLEPKLNGKADINHTHTSGSLYIMIRIHIK